MSGVDRVEGILADGARRRFVNRAACHEVNWPPCGREGILVLVALFGLGVIILAALITMPAAKAAGIKSIVLFVVLSLAGAVGAVIVGENYHLPPSKTEKAEHTQHLINEWLEDQGATVKDGPSAKEMLDRKPALWNLEVQGQPLNLLCTPSPDFPEEAQLSCAETMDLISEKIDVDFDAIDSGH